MLAMMIETSHGFGGAVLAAGIIQPLEEVLRAVRMCSEEEFCAERKVPALALWIPDDSTRMTDSESSLQSTMDEDGFGNLFALAAGRNQVAWLVKSSNNYFANIISFGRAPTNDIQIPLETISKVHAVFMKVGERWRVADRGAKNGLFVAGRQLQDGATVDLREGDILRFGREVEGTFYTPQGLYRFLDNLT